MTVRPLSGSSGPVIDGVLDEALWSEAARIGPLTQVLPIEGADPTVATDVRLTYDRDTVYVGILCRDDPAEVRARQMDRDAFVRYDDVVELWFDPFASERFAYWFQITPGGSIGDALSRTTGPRSTRTGTGSGTGDRR